MLVIALEDCKNEMMWSFLSEGSKCSVSQR